MRFQTFYSIKKALTSVGAFFRFNKEKKIPVRGILFSLLLGILLLSPFLLFSFFSEKSPQEKIETARKLLAKAVELEATIYAPAEYEQARFAWTKAMSEWKNGNENSILYKNFGSASLYAEKAIEKAELTIHKAKKEKQRYKEEYLTKIAEVKKNARFLEQAFIKFPLSPKLRKDFTQYNIKINEAEAAYQRQDIKSALTKVNGILSPIDKMQKNVRSMLQEYFNHFENWKKMDEELQKISDRENRVCLVVDKFNKTCKVYNNGKQIHQFSVELGPNWMGDKKHRGDKATPEGKYHVTKKKSGKNTIYYKSLEINYPNQEDKKRFEEAKRKGEIGLGTTIGNLIAIHGEGGKGIDWTEGCVALENKHMDILFNLCPLGTPVAIVGSLTPLNEIIELE